MKLLWWILLKLCFVASYQISDQNCMRANPRILDAELKFFNKYSDLSKVTEEDFVKHLALFSTRFNRGFELGTFSSEIIMKLINGGLSRFTRWLKNDVKLFLTINPYKEENKTITDAINYYKKVYDLVMEVNVGANGPVAGLFINSPWIFEDEKLEAVEKVFGLNQNSTLPIGTRFLDCFRIFKLHSTYKILPSLQFIGCEVEPVKTNYPEESADEVVETCEKLKAIAVSINVTAEILCEVEYPSYGINDNGLASSLSDFQRFWCRIVDEVKENKSHLQIIMISAFNRTPFDYKNTTVEFNNSLFHNGWWRRRHVTSYEASAFVEKVDELEGGSERGGCSKECGYCRSHAECCEGRNCFLDPTFQPFETEGPKRVCLSVNTTCAPRPPTVLPRRYSNLSPIVSPTTNSAIYFGGSIVNVYTVIISFVFAVIVVVSIAIFWISRGRKANNILTDQEICHFLDGSCSLQEDLIFAGKDGTQDVAGGLPYDKQLEVPSSSFEICEDKILGCGAFGTVLKGSVRNEEVAVKTTLPGVEKAFLKALIQELKVLSFVGKHENIISLRGAHTAQLNEGKLYLFLELCPLGNLLNFVRNHQNNLVDDKVSYEMSVKTHQDGLACKELFLWSLQIASAMGHLAKLNVIHGDIAARNVLVFSKDRVKLTDFGLSRRLYQYAHYMKKTRESVPWRHMSVEALQYLSFSLQSDVWSFGVTLWEIFSMGQVPYSGLSWSQEFPQLLKDGLRLPRPQHALPEMYEVMTSCWANDTQSRPLIVTLHSKLSTMLTDHETQHLCL